MAESVQEVYVGPRPFERSERNLFFGRDREISELLSLVVSSRVVLCYAPSGAGKTSLMNAGLQPRLEQEGFEVLPSTRVRGLIPEGIDQEKVANIYVFNALLSLAGDEGAPAELAGRPLAEYLSTRPHETDEEGFPAPRILIFDQFEELLTSYPERWQEREGFFHQVREALQADPLLRVVFIMREDFLARIEPYVRILKPHQQARFRLALLGPEGAQAAVTGPLRGTGRHFREGVVASLIEELLKVRVETAQGEAVEVVGENVEPVQLQVVCRNLWISLPPDVQEISPEHLKAYGDVDQALRDFYESCLAQAKASLGANEPTMRQWFEQQLITPAGTRGIVFRDAKRTADLPNPVVDFLENRHLIRGEWRAGSRWYELTHDRFIEPIQRANERWRAGRQARRNRWIMAVGGSLFLVMLLLAATFTFRQPVSQSSGVSTAVAATIVIESTNAQATAQIQAQVAQEDVTVSKSRQLAAEALLVDDPDLSLLLAVGANQSADTQEARRSLHKILSRQGVTDGKFLREFDPEIISPTLVKRLEDHNNFVVSVAFSPDGRRFVSGGERGTLFLWDMATGEPVGSPLVGHNSGILSVAFSPDGNLIASTGLDQKILLWNAATGERVGDPLLGHEGLVTSLVFSPDGKRLVSGDELGKLRIWDLSTRQYREVSEPTEIWSLAWSPDGKILAAGSAGEWIHLLDAETFDLIRVLKGQNGLVRTVAWSPDGRSLASGSVVGKDESGEVILWDAASGAIIARPLQNKLWPVRTVAFDPTGRTLAIGQDNGTITLWDTRSQQTVGNPLKAHKHRVMSIAFSPNGQYMVSGSIDKTVALWDLLAPTNSIAVSPNGSVLATSQGTAISLWDLSADNATSLRIFSGHTEDVLALAFSPDGSTLASGGRDDTILLWDAVNGEQLKEPLSGHAGDVLTLAISSDGSTLASGSEDGQILLWDLNSPGLLLNSFDLKSAVSKVRFSEDGTALWAVGKDGALTTLDVRSGETLDQVFPLGRASAGITSVAVATDGQKVALFQEAGNVFLADDRRAHGISISSQNESFDPTVHPDDIDFIVVKATQGRFIDTKFDEFLAPIQAVPMRGAYHFFSADVPWQEQADTFLSAVKDKGFHFFALDLENGPVAGATPSLSDAQQWLKYVDERVDQKILILTRTSYINSLGSSGDWIKEWPLMIAYFPLDRDRNGSPLLPKGMEDWKIWIYSEGRDTGPEYGVTGNSVGGNAVFLNVYNGTPRDMSEWLGITGGSIYDRASGEVMHPDLAIRPTAPNAVAFSPDGTYLAVAGDGKVSLLDAGSGKEITTLSLGGRTILSLNFIPNANRLAIGTEGGTILLWDLSLLQKEADAQPTMDIACSQAKRNFTNAEWAQYFPNEPYRSMCPNLPAP